MDLDAFARRMRELRASALRESVQRRNVAFNQARTVDSVETRRSSEGARAARAETNRS